MSGFAERMSSRSSSSRMPAVVRWRLAPAPRAASLASLHRHVVDQTVDRHAQPAGALEVASMVSYCTSSAPRWSA